MRVSVSQINTWGKCRLAWQYRYKDNLVLPETAAMLASGKAVHGTVEALIRSSVDVAGVPAKAEALLQEYFQGGEDVQKQVQKYLPGVIRAVGRLPQVVFEGEWRVEEQVEWTWPPEMTFPQYEVDRRGEAVTIFGIPDYYRVTEDEVTILEVKSTSTDMQPLDYLLWNPQHRQYAVLLDKMYPGRMVKVLYVVLRTDRNASAVEPKGWVMTKRALDTTERLMLKSASEIGRLAVVPNYSRACSFCDYNKLCQVDVTGGDSKPLQREWYLVREARE